MCVPSILQIHGGSSGIGTFAIQIAKHLGIKVFVTAGSEGKLSACKTEDFVECVREETNGKGITYHLNIYGCLCCTQGLHGHTTTLVPEF